MDLDAELLGAAARIVAAGVAWCQVHVLGFGFPILLLVRGTERQRSTASGVRGEGCTAVHDVGVRAEDAHGPAAPHAAEPCPHV